MPCDQLVKFVTITMLINSYLAGASIALLAIKPERENARYYFIVGIFTSAIAISTLLLLMRLE